ncbi:phosphate ABC transporter substrate-binding protein PstS [Hoyosella rhizosphaerae]|uniref:Phosphate-binding protein n=1 Tax=Hoyosella rhizosphaerae TaxID=1755582 RepID=A0A916UI86_9ACTN|nr:phosphate ABC transporter substrate-binding protein PstS [Hoyosella rhizosphaerae]MBN4928035.1 phosphate ABC transporter substrate-binding protein PstS [Hoyosella rhizosphaerae]GGC71888.1 phosphate-binding protein [Hoyosella rhizosphaerae]
MRSWRSVVAIGATVPFVAFAAACGSNGDSESAEGSLSGNLTGAGATFPNPVFQEWADSFRQEQPGVRINYQSIGSGGGIEQFLRQTVDFGSSERYLTDDALAEAAEGRGCEAIQFPVIFGSVVIAFNDDALDGLVLTSDVIARIYDRDITNYNDPAIQELNPDMDLPDLNIIPVHRSDGSGTTYVFTHYLNTENEMWADKYGEGTEVQWASGTIGGQGNEGVSSQVEQNRGALGYVNQAYAMEIGMPQAAIVNSDGEAISPTLEATTEASELAEIPDSFQFDIDGIGGEGYPITGTNWIFAYECGYDDTTADMLKSYWTWVLTSDEADELALELGYAPMGASLKERVLEQVERINSQN